MMLAIYLVAINLIAFFLCGADKRRAFRCVWRIPERTLLLFTALGGCFGMLLGMLLFRHKIRKRRFQILVPLACLGWAALLLFFIFPPVETGWQNFLPRVCAVF